LPRPVRGEEDTGLLETQTIAMITQNLSPQVQHEIFSLLIEKEGDIIPYYRIYQGCIAHDQKRIGISGC
jgi:hypothetical protein